eukprot:TRINITY_DN7329_c0_g2_i1.p1 TRINITY_DN7329_c0_g2~~TRINITY_DN7329_c0_g2_i1.p1  ORF type:complete len:513 (-),score=56.71 TRINITY_DN7329_c0_g2_i1:43-1581(-)
MDRLKLDVSARMMILWLCLGLSVFSADGSGVAVGVTGTHAAFETGRTFRVTSNDASYVGDGNSWTETSAAIKARSHGEIDPLPSRPVQQQQMDRSQFGLMGDAQTVSKIGLVVWPILMECLSPLTVFSLIANVVLVMVVLMIMLFRPLENIMNTIPPELPKQELPPLFKPPVPKESEDDFLLRRVERLASSRLQITVWKTPSSGQSWLGKNQSRFLAVLPSVDLRSDGSAASRLAEWRTGFLGWWETKSDFSNWCRNGKPAPRGSFYTLDIVKIIVISDVEASLTHKTDGGTTVMFVRFDNAADSKAWVCALQSLLRLLPTSLSGAFDHPLASLAESCFDDRGDSTLVVTNSYAYTLANGLHCELTGWTHTRTYAKGFVSKGPQAARAVVSDLVPGATYMYNVYQWASLFGDSACLSVNGGPRITVTASASEDPSASGTAVASAKGSITFVFIRQGRQVHLSGLALVRRPADDNGTCEATSNVQGDVQSGVPGDVLSDVAGDLASNVPRSGR